MHVICSNIPPLYIISQCNECKPGLFSVKWQKQVKTVLDLPCKFGACSQAVDEKDQPDLKANKFQHLQGPSSAFFPHLLSFLVHFCSSFRFLTIGNLRYKLLGSGHWREGGVFAGVGAEGGQSARSQRKSQCESFLGVIPRNSRMF